MEMAILIFIFPRPVSCYIRKKNFFWGGKYRFPKFQGLKTSFGKVWKITCNYSPKLVIGSCCSKRCVLTVSLRSDSHTAVYSDSMGRVHLHNKFFRSSKVESERAVLLSIVAFKPIRIGQENSCGLRCKNKKSPEAPRADLQGCANKSRDEMVLFLCLGFSDAISCCCLEGKSAGLKAVTKQNGGSWWLRVWGEVETLQCHFRLWAFLLPSSVAVFSPGPACALSRSAARACSGAQAAVLAAPLPPADALRFPKRRAPPRAPKSPPASLSRSKTMSGMEVC